jgi:hypothetical protein
MKYKSIYKHGAKSPPMKNTDLISPMVLPIFFMSLLLFSGCAKPIPSAHPIPIKPGIEHLIYSGPLYRAILVDNVGNGVKP